jgi:hypothetical protein
VNCREGSEAKATSEDKTTIESGEVKKDMGIVGMHGCETKTGDEVDRKFENVDGEKRRSLTNKGQVAHGRIRR